jgi:hypothetical protein
MNYGEAASAISIITDRGHLFKMFYRGLDENTLIWTPYDNEDNELTLPCSFRFEIGYSDNEATIIFNCIIKPCTLLAEFYHGRGKLGTSSRDLDKLPTYEFYNPNFVARQFGLGQLPPRLFFSNLLRPRESTTEGIEASRVFRLGTDLLSFHLEEWSRATFSSSLFDSWWQGWHSHLFCGPAHARCMALDEDFSSDSEVIFSLLLMVAHLFQASSSLNVCRILSPLLRW